ncbi:MAG TPA: universal stress protein [Syntrophobacteraceae bacterium]|nr:universal stress protein [Syntrophobacteraceae bacterium]
MNDTVQDRILITNDGSEHSMQTVRYAADILDPGRFEVVLFHVATRVPESFIDFEARVPAYHYRLVSVEAWEEQQRKAVREFMAKARAILLDAGFKDEAITVRIAERKVGIARDIAYESRNGYKALVVGRRGLSDLKDFMLGTVAEHIVGLAPIPVWIVGGNHLPAKVLACLDGSEGSMVSLAHLAEALDTSKSIEITLFHAVHGFHSFRNFMREVFSSHEDKTAIEKIDSELDKAAALMEPSFDKAKATLISRGVDPALIHQKVARGAGNPAHAIIEEAEKGEYDTILVGRRGLSRGEEFIMGRVSSRVMHMAKDKTVWVVC